MGVMVLSRCDGLLPTALSRPRDQQTTAICDADASCHFQGPSASRLVDRAFHLAAYGRLCSTCTGDGKYIVQHDEVSKGDRYSIFCLPLMDALMIHKILLQ